MAAGHIPLRKQREMNTGAQLTFFFILYSIQDSGLLDVAAWPCSGYVFPPQLNVPGNILTDLHRGVS